MTFGSATERFSAAKDRAQAYRNAFLGDNEQPTAGAGSYLRSGGSSIPSLVTTRSTPPPSQDTGSAYQQGNEQMADAALNNAFSRTMGDYNAMTGLQAGLEKNSFNLYAQKKDLDNQVRMAKLGAGGSAMGWVGTALGGLSSIVGALPSGGGAAAAGGGFGSSAYSMPSGTFDFGFSGLGGFG